MNPMDVSVVRLRAEYFEWQFLSIFGIVQWYHLRPRRRGRGFDARSGVACGGPLWVALVLWSIDTWVPSRRIIYCWDL